jgi:6-phospho-beta-glucosidase
MPFTSGDGVKIAVIGAGSTYTPELVEGIVRLRESLAVTEVVLHDTDRARLDTVGSAAVRILRAQGWDGQVSLTTDLDRAVDSATAVLLQIRVGGQAARHLDETIPLACGCIGQETTGAGGFSKALRTVPVVLDIAQRVRQRAGDDAWIIDFTNPVGIVTRALLDAGHRAVGLCNVAIGFQRLFAQWLDVPADRVRLGHAGLNHLTWIRSVLVDGEDALPQLLSTRGAELAGHVELPPALLDLLGAVPSYYLRYFYMHDEVLEELRTAPSRADQVRAVEEELLALYADPALERSPELLSKRGGAHYSDAALNLLTSLTQDVGDVQVVDMRNNGIIADLPDDAVVEVPAVVTRDGPRAVDVPAPDEPELALMRHVAVYERLTVQAAQTGDRDVALRALLAHPLIGQWGPAERVLGDLLHAHRELLPAMWR